MKTIKLARMLVPTVLLAGALLLALFSSHMGTWTPAHAAAAQPANSWNCAVWDRCKVTQHYKQNEEHGIDLYTHYLPITALLPGTVTFVHRECWEWPCIMDITWRLDRQVCYYRVCAPFMYVQIRTSSVWVGEHVRAGQVLGMSGVFIEVGFTHSDAYGVHGNWYTDWTFDPLKIFPWL